MNELSFHENFQRGTLDFPMELYHLDFAHPQYVMQLHWHNDIEMIRVLNGTLNLILNSINYTLQSGECIIIPSGIAHCAQPEHCVYECLVFSPSVLYAVPKCHSILKRELCRPVIFKNLNEVNLLFEHFKKTEQEYTEFEILSLIYSIVGKAIHVKTGEPIKAQKNIDKIKPAIMYITENFTSPITVQDMADRCFMSCGYFSKCFREATAQTPIEFLTIYRIETACEMLLSGNVTVTDAAYNCGFNDLSYFIHIFKKIMGISPKQYALRK